MSNSEDFDIGISSSELIPTTIPDQFAEEAKECGSIVASERRPEEIFAGIEWLLPTAIVVFIAQKYVGSLLQEAGKDHYLKIKTALVKLARKTTGQAREVRLVNVASSKHKTQGSEPVVLSVVFFR